MNFDPLSISVLVAGAGVALAAILTVLYDAIKNHHRKNENQTLSVKSPTEQNCLEIQEIKQEDDSLVIKISLKKSDSGKLATYKTKVANA